MRIVSHTCSNTEIVCALGCADMLVGVDDHSDYPVEVVRDLPRIGPDLVVNVERVKRLDPDLVLSVCQKLGWAAPARGSSRECAHSAI